MSKILLCVDDTDDVSKKTSTGTIAEIIAVELKKMGANIIDGITRHQLLLDPRINYTSHNSSMCMEAEGTFENLEEVWNRAREIMVENVVESANPGMALLLKDSLEQKTQDELIDFGKRAKKCVFSIAEARELAEASGVRLEAIGGNGAGQIGALAGIGLRLSGNDGTFRGKIKMDSDGQIVSSRDLKDRFDIKEIQDLNGISVPEDAQICIDKKIKLSYIDYGKVLVVREIENGVWKICPKDELYEKNKYVQQKIDNCHFFTRDNDIEEQLDEADNCRNCLYRRWTESGILCVR